MSIETLIDNTSRERAVEAAYYAARELERGSSPERAREYHLEETEQSAPSAEALELAASIIDTITNDEGVELASLTDDRKSHYLKQILIAVERSIDEEFQPDEARASILLDELRRS